MLLRAEGDGNPSAFFHQPSAFFKEDLSCLMRTLLSQMWGLSKKSQLWAEAI
jgi:hypothetical protein